MKKEELNKFGGRKDENFLQLFHVNPKGKLYLCPPHCFPCIK